MKPLLILSLGVALLTVAQQRGSAADVRASHLAMPQSTWDSVFTDSQSRRGDTVFKTTCAKCHGDNLAGSDSAAPLSGPDFLSNWDGLSLDQLYDKIMSTMPSDKPKSLDSNQVSSVLAFVLSKNGFPAGKQVLPADMAKLKDIKFQKSKP